MVSEASNSSAREAQPLTVLYDGACPLCRREIGLYSGRQPNTPLCFADVSDAALPLPSGTTRAQLRARFHVRRADGDLSCTRAATAWPRWAAMPVVWPTSTLRYASPPIPPRPTAPHSPSPPARRRWAHRRPCWRTA